WLGPYPPACPMAVLRRHGDGPCRRRAPQTPPPDRPGRTRRFLRPVLSGRPLPWLRPVGTTGPRTDRRGRPVERLVPGGVRRVGFDGERRRDAGGSSGFLFRQGLRRGGRAGAGVG